MKRILVITFATIMVVLAMMNGGIAFATGTGNTYGYSYAALGDSVAAGYGLRSYNNRTDEDERCRRSPDSYASKVAVGRNLVLNHVACTGAKAGDLFTQQNVRGGDMGPQLDAAFASGRPSLITITAGANDTHWDEFVAKCYLSGCGGFVDDHLVDGLISVTKIKLRYALSDINLRSNGYPPRVVLTGYYNPFSPTCTLVQNDITADEMTWLSGKLTGLNDAIREVSSEFPNARFASVDFTGHDICSESPWVQDQRSPAPFHPTAEGQDVIARSILDVL